jgi:hypothetical protein
MTIIASALAPKIHFVSQSLSRHARRPMARSSAQPIEKLEVAPPL